MQKVIIEPTASTPEILIDPTQGRLKITGNSYPSNAPDFYQPVINWLDIAIQDTSITSLEVWFFFNYLNTSSTKIIIRILELLEDFYKMGKKCTVYWQYDDGDENMSGIGDDLKNYVNVPFDLIKVY